MATVVKRGRGRPRKGSQPPPKKQEVSLSSATGQFYDTPTPLSSLGSNHALQTPEVKAFLFNGMSTRYKAKLMEADRFYTSMFNPDAQELQCNELNPSPKIPDCKQTVISQDEFYSKVPLSSSIQLALDTEKTMNVTAGSSLPFPANEAVRYGRIINSGGLPLATVWDPEPVDGGQYLYVSMVASDPSELSSASQHINRLALGRASSFDAAIVVYRYDLASHDLEPVKHILLERGAATSIKWLVQGHLLSIVFTDGTCGIVKTDAKFLKGEFTKLKKCSTEISLQEEDLTILCSTWTSAQTVLVGTMQGCIAEFDITSSDPLYVLPLSMPSITGMASDYGDELFGPAPTLNRANSVLVSTGALEVCLIDLADPSLLIGGPKTRVPATTVQYSSLNNGFFYADSTRALRFSSVRNSSATLKVKTNDEPPLSVASSDFSPLVLAGCNNGAVRLANFWDSIAPPSKSKHQGAVRLYKLEVVDDHLRLDLGYKFTNDEVVAKKYYAYPNTVAATSCAMANSPTSNNIIATTYGSGVIIVETLQQVKQTFTNI